MNSSCITTLRPKTKIVCTFGPATESEDTVRALIEGGMSIARVNCSHGTLASHAAVIKRVRSVSRQVGIPVGIMVDVPGKKYRTRLLAPDGVELKSGDKLTLTSDDVIDAEDVIGVSPPGIHQDVEVAVKVFINDGRVELRVLEIRDSNVVCEVVRGGKITQGRGIVIPGRQLSQKFPDQVAMAALRFAAEQKADFVALSMVTAVSEIHVAREILSEYGLEENYIISKIERAAALITIDNIVEASDAIMVARGDLGVEVPLERVPIIQKDLIARCNAAGKPVITATQMLESMIRSDTPTRAEVADVANAVYDGTDAIMLSGETAVGEYPVQSVQVMARVAAESEDALPYDTMMRDKWWELEQKTDDAISYDACVTANQLDASLIIAFTESGSTAARVSRFRPRPPILALTPDKRVRVRLTLHWGVIPVTVGRVRTVDDFFVRGEKEALRIKNVHPGSQVVLVAGLPIGVKGSTNLLRVMTLSQAHGNG